MQSDSLETRVNPNEDLIDSRDVIDRIEELEEERYHIQDQIEELEEPGLDPEGQKLDVLRRELKDWDADDDLGGELKRLQELQSQAEGYISDWKHGVALVRDSYFKQHAMDEAEAVGAIDPNASWPLNCIDWDKAADELQMDYTSVEYGEVTFWVRS